MDNQSTIMPGCLPGGADGTEPAGAPGNTPHDGLSHCSPREIPELGIKFVELRSERCGRVIGFWKNQYCPRGRLYGFTMTPFANGWQAVLDRDDVMLTRLYHQSRRVCEEMAFGALYGFIRYAHRAAWRTARRAKAVAREELSVAVAAMLDD